jgi:FSR family fosmidomycin resistance protein-like MFS transporter
MFWPKKFKPLKKIYMTTESISISPDETTEFQTKQILPVVGAHFIHDLYTAAIPALLPIIMEKLSLSLTMVGSLMAILQIPALLNPLIGYLADKVSLRYFVILAPAVTATLISSLGFASNYVSLAIILFTTGISVACFHVPAPAMIARVSGNQVGKGMSFFMAAGELSRSVGPLLAVWAVSMWTLDGFYRVVVLGWAASLILYFKLRDVPARVEQPMGFRSIIPLLRSVFLPLFVIMFFRIFLRESLTTFLPTYMNIEGANLWLAAGALSILEFAGVGGALASGTLSDRFGRKLVLLVATVSGAIFTLVFLWVDGWTTLIVLLALGFTVLSTGPVLLALVQDHFQKNRAVGNGMFMLVSFFVRPFALVAIGFLGDRFGLNQVYFWSALLSLLSIPAIFALPKLTPETGNI